ncbi:MAG: hypothetical protein JRJ62_16325 [Deltaproteobacteria bacterium]|nr:hypothetical protein [Deltaproteobacteria bacterium]
MKTNFENVKVNENAQSFTSLFFLKKDEEATLYEGIKTGMANALEFHKRHRQPANSDVLYQCTKVCKTTEEFCAQCMWVGQICKDPKTAILIMISTGIIMMNIKEDREMEQKPHPFISPLNHGKDSLWNTFGISDERRKEIQQKLDLPGKNSEKGTLPEVVKAILKIANSHNELALMMFDLGQSI